MVSQALLEPGTFQVFRRIPLIWWPEATTRDEIAVTLDDSPASVQQRIQHLIKLGLVERRTRATIMPTTEIRKVGK